MHAHGYRAQNGNGKIRCRCRWKLSGVVCLAIRVWQGESYELNLLPDATLRTRCDRMAESVPKLWGGGLQDAWNNPSLELPTTPQVHNFVLVRQLGVDATLGTFGTMKREGTNGLVPSTTIKIIL